MSSLFKKTLVVANWKLYVTSLKDAKDLCAAATAAASFLKRTQAVLCAPFVFVPHLAHRKNISIGAQDVFWASEGAYTGEVSARMLAAVSATHVIVGHSERRDHAGDTDEIVAKKARAALASGLTAIVCVGERERAGDGSSLPIVKKELVTSLKGISRSLVSRLVIAYEPIWAISSHHPKATDTPENTLEMSIYIRKILHDLYGKAAASRVRVLYGGSVSPENVRGFLERGGVDGILVGRASTSAKSFGKIVQIAEGTNSKM